MRRPAPAAVRPRAPPRRRLGSIYKILILLGLGLLLAGMSALGQWRARTTFVLALAAAAVGMGNLWRFSYLLGTQGGGAFMLTYLACLLLGAALALAVALSPVLDFAGGYPGVFLAGLVWFAFFFRGQGKPDTTTA